jgi:hypothetical protein
MEHYKDEEIESSLQVFKRKNFKFKLDYFFQTYQGIEEREAEWYFTVIDDVWWWCV